MVSDFCGQAAQDPILMYDTKICLSRFGNLMATGLKLDSSCNKSRSSKKRSYFVYKCVCIYDFPAIFTRLAEIARLAIFKCTSYRIKSSPN